MIIKKNITSTGWIIRFTSKKKKLLKPKIMIRFKRVGEIQLKQHQNLNQCV